MVKRMHVFNGKFVFLVDKKEHMNVIKQNPNLIVFFERGLYPIQVHFRNKKFRRNYKLYRDELKNKKDDILWKGIPEELKTLKNYYLLVCFNKRKMYEFVAWDMVSYDSYRCEIDKQIFSRFSLANKDVIIEGASRFFDIDTVRSTLHFNEHAARDHLEKIMQDQI
jgi:hypothetical protein